MRLHANRRWGGLHQLGHHQQARCISLAHLTDRLFELGEGTGICGIGLVAVLVCGKRRARVREEVCEIRGSATSGSLSIRGGTV